MRKSLSLKKIIAQNLRTLRHHRHVHSITLEAVTGSKTKDDYYRYEDGRSIPSITVLCKLADFYGVSVDYLLGRGCFSPCRQGEKAKTMHKPVIEKKFCEEDNESWW